MTVSIQTVFDKGRRAWPSLLIVADAGTTALSNALSLLIAARLLVPGTFGVFALIQLIVVTTSMIQRAFVLAPGLASQRAHGKGSFSPSLALQMSLPTAVFLAICVMTTRGFDGPQLLLPISALIAAWGSLSMDVVRYCLLTRNMRAIMVGANACWGAMQIGGLFLVPKTPEWFLLAWGLSGLCVALPAGYLLVRRSPTTNAISPRKAWSLGKWSGLDATLSAAANLLPMIAATAVANSELVGTYRLLQSTLGPLNIVSSSLMTIYSIDSWQLTTKSGIYALHAKVRRFAWLMSAGSFLYIAVAEVVMLTLSGRWGPDSLRICAIVTAVGLLGSLTASYSAGALALGAQRSGAALRVVIVAWSASMTALMASNVSLPWNDPIGPVTLFAAVAGLIGWTFAYRRALRRAYKAASSSTQEAN